MYIKTLSNLYIFLSLNQCFNIFSVFLLLQNFQDWSIRILLAENFSPITLQINFIAITCLITLLHKNINIKWHNYKLITSYCYIQRHYSILWTQYVLIHFRYQAPQNEVFLMFCNSLAIDLFLIIVDVSTFLVHQLKQFIVICRLICSKGSIAIGVFYRCLTKPFCFRCALCLWLPTSCLFHVRLWMSMFWRNWSISISAVLVHFISKIDVFDI